VDFYLNGFSLSLGDFFSGQGIDQVRLPKDAPVPRTVFPVCLMLASLVCAPSLQAGTLPSGQLVDTACRQVMGLNPGETYFASCRESLSHSLVTTDHASQPITIADDAGAEPGKSFYNVPPMVRWTRERRACAGLGLAPKSAAFGQCVTSLDNAFLPSPN
jgi:hypothetical protein